MSADGSIEFDWGDGTYRFRLAIGQLRELQEKVNRRRVNMGLAAIGPMSLLNLFASRDAWPDDAHDVLLLGLIGGGKKPVEALTLVRRYCDERPIVESMPAAQIVLMTALIGAPDDPVGKKTAAEETATGTMIVSSSPPSTETVPQSDGTINKSTTPPSGNSLPPLKAGTESTAEMMSPTQ